MSTALDHNRLAEVAGPLFGQYPIRFAYLHGSRATGEAGPDSDVDIAIMTDPLPPDEQLRLELDLEIELAQQMSGFSFDVRSLNAAPLAARGTVVQRGRSIYCRDDSARIDFEVLTRKLYFDFRPTFEAHRVAYVQRRTHATTIP